VALVTWTELRAELLQFRLDSLKDRWKMKNELREVKEELLEVREEMRVVREEMRVVRAQSMTRPDSILLTIITVLIIGAFVLLQTLIWKF
jgi:hypothetical protein